MIGFLVALAAGDNCTVLGETNCVLCVDTKIDGHTCGFCRTTRLCFDTGATNFTECDPSNRSSSRDLVCVAELGGDAIPRNRYIIGAVFLALAIAVDVTIRFCSDPDPELSDSSRPAIRHDG
jgi:hypothetical protein